MTVPVDAVVVVRSADVVTSPLTGEIGALVHVEILERIALSGAGGELFASRAELVLGDVVTLAIADGEAEILASVVARRVTFGFVTTRPEPVVLDVVPPELVALVVKLRRGGAVAYRQHLVRSGDRLRFRGIVERSGSRVVVRDDLAPVRLDEVVML